jgi:aminopeptidase N
MANKTLLIATALLFIFGCKPIETINLPEQVIEINDPNKLPERAVYQASNTKIFDLIHTKLDVKFNWEKAYLYGKAELTLKPYFHANNTLALNARGFDINKVQLVDENNIDLKYHYDDLMLIVDLDKEYTRNDTLKIFIDYTAKPDELTEGGSDAISSDKGLYFINPRGEEKDKPQQIWTQGETQSSSAWFPTIDSPNERCTGEIAITVEDKYKTLSNGILNLQTINADGTRTDFWEMDQPHAPYLFMMAIGEFDVTKETWKGIDVDYYLEKDYAPYAKDIFGLTTEMLEFYSNRLGVNYPWKKYSQIVVRDYVSGAMENTTAVIHGEFVQQTKRELLDGSAGEDVISHELFHHWFGDLVTCESWSNLPLNESFATYGEYLWNEYKYGLDKADYGLKNDLSAYLQEAEDTQVDMIRFDYESREDMFDAHSYQKGGRILHMLRNYLGDDAFFESLKFYLNKHQFTDVEMHEFRIACEDVSGEDLNWFFNQWFYASGHPMLNINYEYDDSLQIQTVYISQEQNFNTTPLYKLPIAIDIYAEGKVERKEVVIDKAVNVFSYEMNSKPDLVNVDGDKMLLCEKIDNHTNEEWAFMYYNAPKYLDRYEAIRKLAEINEAIATKTIIDALGDKFEHIRRTAIRSLKFAVKENPEEVKTKLIELVSKEENTKVKGDAIAMIGRYFAKDDIALKIFQENIESESYYISSKALYSLSVSDKNDALKYAKKYEDETNLTLINAVATVYEKHGGSEQNNFFIEKYAELDGFGKYSFISSYGNYLQRQPDNVIEEALPLLEEVSLKEEAWWMRMTGINAVAELENKYIQQLIDYRTELKTLKSDSPEAIELNSKIESAEKQRSQLMAIIEKVKATETNPRLKQILGIK